MSTTRDSLLITGLELPFPEASTVAAIIGSEVARYMEVVGIAAFVPVVAVAVVTIAAKKVGGDSLDDDEAMEEDKNGGEDIAN